MKTQFFILLINIILINIGFMVSFFIRYGLLIPERSFLPYKNSFIFLTLIYLSVLAVFGVYKSRFMSSWDLFKRILGGLFLGTLLSIVFVYVFRIKWGAFPTTVFAISFFINLLLIFKFNQWLLKRLRKIKKNVIILGKGDIKCLTGKMSVVSRIHPNAIRHLKTDFKDIDQIIIADLIKEGNLIEYVTMIAQRFGIDIVYTPVVYMKLVNDRVNENNPDLYPKTFEGQKRDAEEFFIRLIDAAASLAAIVILLPVAGIVALAVKLASPGPILYKQLRVGKDGKHFVIYKFRTMYKDSETLKGFQPAVVGDKRITPVGHFLRRYRFDEIPQFVNIIKGQMSLVGPRPENVFRVNSHKSLQGIRLAVKPGLTGLAQIRSFYDLAPRQKIKYDYLYIQRRSLRLNLYILLSTVPALFSKKGQ